MTKENSPTGDRNKDVCTARSNGSPAIISSSQLRKVLPPVTTTSAANITHICSRRKCRSINSPTERKNTNNRMDCTGAAMFSAARRKVEWPTSKPHKNAPSAGDRPIQPDSAAAAKHNPTMPKVPTSKSLSR